jgi:excisionase family DNA binding protein
MTVRQAARRLEVAPSTVYSLIAAGKLQASRHGVKRGTIRISEDQLAAYQTETRGIPAPRINYGSLRL